MTTQQQLDGLANSLGQFASLSEHYYEFLKFKDKYLEAEQKVVRQRTELEELAAKYRDAKIKADTYQLILNSIKENDHLADEWSSFFMTMKLAIPDIEKQFQKIIRDNEI